VADHTAAEPPTGAGAGAGGQATLTAQYEQLRRIALGGPAEGWRHGLGVLATRGMTGWMNACRTLALRPAPPAPSTRGAGSDAIAEGAGDMIRVLAAMAMAHV
jgi:hypothetical protein